MVTSDSDLIGTMAVSLGELDFALDKTVSSMVISGAMPLLRHGTKTYEAPRS